MSKQKFNHKHVCIDASYTETHLGKMERDGWELISVVPSTTVPNGMIFFWKQQNALIVRPDRNCVGLDYALRA